MPARDLSHFKAHYRVRHCDVKARVSRIKVDLPVRQPEASPTEVPVGRGGRGPETAAQTAAAWQSDSEPALGPGSAGGRPGATWGAYRSHDAGNHGSFALPGLRRPRCFLGARATATPPSAVIVTVPVGLRAEAPEPDQNKKPGALGSPSRAESELLTLALDQGSVTVQVPPAGGRDSDGAGLSARRASDDSDCGNK